MFITLTTVNIGNPQFNKPDRKVHLRADWITAIYETTSTQYINGESVVNAPASYVFLRGQPASEGYLVQEDHEQIVALIEGLEL